MASIDKDRSWSFGFALQSPLWMSLVVDGVRSESEFESVFRCWVWIDEDRSKGSGGGAIVISITVSEVD